MASKSKQASPDSPVDRLQQMRLYLQYMQPPTPMQLQPVSDPYQAMAQGVTNFANSLAQRRYQERMIKVLSQVAETQQQAEQQAAQQAAANQTNFLISAGVDPWVAINAGSAGIDSSTQNALLNNQHTDAVSQEQLRQKLATYASYQQALKAKGLSDADATLMANSALFGERLPIGASELGANIGGALKDKVLFNATGGNPNGLNQSAASPSLQMHLNNYGISPMDAITEVQRQAQARTSATNANYLPVMNDASLARTTAQTTGIGYDNIGKADTAGRIQTQAGLRNELIQGNVTMPEFLKGYAATSDSPVATWNTITGNKVLGKMFPNPDSFNYPPANPPQPSVPPQPAQPTNPLGFQYNPSMSPEANGSKLRQHLLNKVEPVLKSVPGNFVGSVNHFLDGIDTGIRGTFGFFGVPTNPKRQ